MQAHCDINLNTVTVFGKNAAHRINTGRSDPHNLKWKKAKSHLGYGKAVDEVEAMVQKNRGTIFPVNGGYRTFGSSLHTGFGLPQMQRRR